MLESIIVLRKSFYQKCCESHCSFFYWSLLANPSVLSYYIWFISEDKKKPTRRQLELASASRSMDIIEKKRHGFGDAHHRTHSSQVPQQLLFRWHCQFHLLDYECTFYQGENSIYFNRKHFENYSIKANWIKKLNDWANPFDKLLSAFTAQS